MKTCTQCGKQFKVRFTKDGKKYDLRCRSKCLECQPLKIQQPKVKIKCLNCNKETTNSKFCSVKCSVSYLNHIYPKRKRVYKKCLICNKQMSSKHKKYCSNTCYSKAREIEYNKVIDETGLLHPKKSSHRASNAMKRYIAQKNGNQCSICGQLPFWNNKPMILILDHINGKSNDWRVENLRLVCSNCDSQLPTYKAKNKNKGRPR